MEILISVVIPTYNNEDTIILTLESISQQNFKNYEVIIINDGSIDNSKEKIDEYIKDKMNFKQIYKTNTGVSDSRNYGIENAKGKYITFLDADDYIEKDYFLNFNNDNNDNDLVVYGYKQHYKDRRKNVCVAYTIECGQKKQIYELLNRKNLFNIVWNKFFKRELLQNIKFNTSFDLGEDMDFVIQFLKQDICKKIIIYDKCYYNYMLSLDGLGFKKRKDTFLDRYEIYLNLVEFYEVNNYSRDYLDDVLFKVYLSGFMALNTNNFEDFYQYIDKSNELFNFSKSQISSKYKLVNSLINLKSKFILKILTVILIKFDCILQRKEFGLEKSSRKG